MPAFPATAFEHDLVLKKIPLYGLKPAEELFAISLVLLREIGPLPAEVLGGLRFVRIDLVQFGKPRHSADDLVLTVTFFAREDTLDYFLVFVFAGISQQNVAAAGRAGEQV